MIRGITVAAALLLLTACNSHAASLLKCGSGPLDIHDCPVGPQGQQGDAGVKGDKGDQGVAGVDGQNGADGKNGVDGKDGANGKDGTDFDMDKALALSSAMSMPVWLGDSESIRISGGLGFSESETAFGATAVFRLDPLDKGLAGFVGGAVSTDGDGWAGRAGLSYGW